MAKKHKKINKQAAKLKEMRKNAPTHVALAMVQGVQDFYKRCGVDNIYTTIDTYREKNKNKWYDRCYIPYYEAGNCVIDAIKEKNNEDTGSFVITDIIDFLDSRYPQYSNAEKKEMANDMLRMMYEEAILFIPSAAAWRQHKQIFRFDIDFFESLTLSEEEIFKAGNEEILTRSELQTLPFPSFYVELPIQLEGYNFCGFFFSYNGLRNNSTDCLNIYYVNEMADKLVSIPNSIMNKSLLLTTQPFEIKYNLHDETPNATIWENYSKDWTKIDEEKATEEEISATRQREKMGFILLFTALRAVTYLASQYADVTPNKVSKRTFKHTTEIRDIPSEMLIWDVGTRHGSIKRKITEEEQNREPQVIYNEIGKVYRPASKKKAHSRAGHFQHFWYGKKDGSEVRRRERKWVDPTSVNYKGKEIEELEKLPAVYHEVVSFEESTDIK